jgi:hypothetical protein
MENLQNLLTVQDPPCQGTPKNLGKLSELNGKKEGVLCGSTREQHLQPVLILSLLTGRFTLQSQWNRSGNIK